MATLIQAALLGGLFIVLPLVLLRRRTPPAEAMPARPSSGWGARLLVLVYFLALGIGYLFVEMALIQRLVFFLANPVYAVAVALAGLLLVSGLGSGWAARRLGWPLAARMGVAFVLMLPLAAMGMPFPLALRYLGRAHRELLPWAWAVNGCASVVATSLATLLALGVGLATVLAVATGCYVAAALVSLQWEPLSDA